MNITSRIAFVLILISSVLTISLLLNAEETNKDSNTENINELLKTFDFIGDTKKISVSVESSYDAVQKSGQSIEFGAISNWHIKRPNKVRIDIKNRDGNERNFYFDGNTITLYDKDQNVYAEVNKKGSIDQAFDYYMDELDMPLPLAELFSKDHPFDLKKSITSSTFLGDSTINGYLCDDLAYRTEDIDMQIWIQQQKNPLPHRFVLTYNNSPGKPQYRAQFKNWDLSPKVPDSLFKFKPPKDAEKIQFSPRIKK